MAIKMRVVGKKESIVETIRDGLVKNIRYYPKGSVLEVNISIEVKKDKIDCIR